jgi:hypothetical protein
MTVSTIDEVNREEGHGMPLLAALVAAIGGILLMIGAVGDTDALTISRGVVLAVGLLAVPIAAHLTIDYDIYARLEALEGKRETPKE